MQFHIVIAIPNYISQMKSLPFLSNPLGKYESCLGLTTLKHWPVLISLALFGLKQLNGTSYCNSHMFPYTNTNKGNTYLLFLQRVNCLIWVSVSYILVLYLSSLQARIYVYLINVYIVWLVSHLTEYPKCFQFRQKYI